MVNCDPYYVCTARSEGMGPTGVEVSLIIPIKKPNIIVAFCLWRHNYTSKQLLNKYRTQWVNGKHLRTEQSKNSRSSRSVLRDLTTNKVDAQKKDLNIAQLHVSGRSYLIVSSFA